MGSRRPPAYPPEQQDHQEYWSDEDQEIQPESRAYAARWLHGDGHMMLLQKRNQVVIAELGHDGRELGRLRGSILGRHR